MAITALQQPQENRNNSVRYRRIYEISGITKKVENRSNDIADYGSGIANCLYHKYLDDFRFTYKGNGGVKK